MLTTPDSETPTDTESAPSTSGPIIALNFDIPPRLIAELVCDPHFPKSALGLHVDIAGITGIITEIAGRSVKVRTPEGSLKSYNAHTLFKLHAPALRPDPSTTPRDEAPVAATPTAATDESEDEEPERQYITDPDFTLPLQPIADWVRRTDFPQCTFGAHLDLGGYTGVVVEIVRQSLKVLSPEGDLRSYNASVLRKLHGGR